MPLHVRVLAWLFVVTAGAVAQATAQGPKPTVLIQPFSAIGVPLSVADRVGMIFCSEAASGIRAICPDEAARLTADVEVAPCGLEKPKCAEPPKITHDAIGSVIKREHGYVITVRLSDRTNGFVLHDESVEAATVDELIPKARELSKKVLVLARPAPSAAK